MWARGNTLPFHLFVTINNKFIIIIIIIIFFCCYYYTFIRNKEEIQQIMKQYRG
jgi:hypothetical protein